MAFVQFSSRFVHELAQLGASTLRHMADEAHRLADRETDDDLSGAWEDLAHALNRALGVAADRNR